MSGACTNLGFEIEGRPPLKPGKFQTAEVTSVTPDYLKAMQITLREGRPSLGAQTGDVLRLVVREGMLLVAFGIGLGIVGALGLTRVIASLLFGVKPTDLVTLVAVAAVLGGIGLLACVVPARRTTKVDPMEALRHE